ncbi:MAG: ChaN family lipoprotein, partial [Methylotenera sp.]|nr:ChaN family lipoprotein [Oligoflexia bacterium]
MGNLKARARPPGQLENLQKLQKQIYRSLQKQTDHLLGSASLELKAYERTYHSELKAELPTARRTTKAKLLDAIQNHEVTFLGDFHTYPQSQRTALRLLRELIGSPARSSRPSRRSVKKITWKIGLEMIPTKHQNALDDFQAGRIDLRRFHERIHYQEEWGFPWQNYAPLFEWARENDIPLIALNRPKDLFTGSATLRRAGRR